MAILDRFKNFFKKQNFTISEIIPENTEAKQSEDIPKQKNTQNYSFTDEDRQAAASARQIQAETRRIREAIKLEKAKQDYQDVLNAGALEQEMPEVDDVDQIVKDVFKSLFLPNHKSPLFNSNSSQNQPTQASEEYQDFTSGTVANAPLKDPDTPTYPTTQQTNLNRYDEAQIRNMAGMLPGDLKDLIKSTDKQSLSRLIEVVQDGKE